MTKKTDNVTKTKKEESPKSEKKVPAKKEKTTPAKAEKIEKRDIPSKKLPKLLKKTYTEKQLQKKLYKKIYIPEDKQFLESFIKETGKNKKDLPVYSIPNDLLFTKKEIAKLKTLAKEIKIQKSRVRWGPLFATILVLTAIIVGLSFAKNIIAKKAIQSVCETAFEAKCDIDSLDISFINSYFKLHGLQIANKSEPMKNLVQIERIAFDFDLLQLLRAKFVANELSITGVATNTDRTYSGDISAKLQAKIQKKKEKQAKKAAKKNEDSEFMKELTSKSKDALDTLTSSVTGLFDQYNPETILKNCYAQLQTPDVAKSTEEEAKALIAKYKEKPQEINAKIITLKTSFDEISKIDINAIKTDPIKIKAAIESINKTYEDVNKLKSETDKLANDIKKDVNASANMSKNIQNAINHDKNLVGTEISKYTSLNISDGKRFITGTFDNIAYQFLGKYYPHVKKAVAYLTDFKNNPKYKREKKPAKKILSTPTERAEGRTVFFDSDNAPKIWIKKAAGSGPNFSFDALDITNDMDKTGKPVTGNVTLSFAELDHKAKLVIDTRSNSNEPLVLANYNCDKLPLNYPTSKFGDAPGVPGIETQSNLDFLIKLYENDGFDITGTGKFTNMNITTVPFEPEFASNIYANTLANIKEMKLSATAGYTLSSGLNLNLTSDVDKQFINALSKEMASQLTVIKEKAEIELMAKLNELSGGALGEINNFDDIKAKLTEYTNTVNNMANQLDAKRKEAENALTAAAKSTATETVNKAKEQATETAKNKLKGMLGQ